ncbi:MAG: response regulator transcription factor [Elusimicrobiota bacterium]|nr:response regulator transcription factor [Elusimicrobiota bacterium]
MVEKILVVEDDEETQEFLKEGLQLEGYQIIQAYTGKEGLIKVRKEKPNLVLLDLGLPDIDGIGVCRQIKQTTDTRAIPVIMLTARVTTDDKITGLEAGADDYIPKPFDPRELVARIKALFRRIEYYAPQADEIISKGGITLDVGKRKVTVSFQEDVELSPKEFQLLYLLMRNSGQVLERKYLLKSLWGYREEVESRTVDVHVQRLRKKLSQEAGRFSEHISKRIVTIEGIGYKFIA